MEEPKTDLSLVSTDIDGEKPKKVQAPSEQPLENLMPTDPEQGEAKVNEEQGKEPATETMHSTDDAEITESPNGRCRSQPLGQIPMSKEPTAVRLALRATASLSIRILGLVPLPDRQRQDKIRRRLAKTQIRRTTSVMARRVRSGQRPSPRTRTSRTWFGPVVPHSSPFTR